VHLLYFWRGDNYRRDLDHGVGFHLNQANPLLHQIGIGESLWTFTRKRDGRYALAAELVISAKTMNPRGFRYGPYRVWGDLRRSRYFSVDGQPDIFTLIRSLAVEANAEVLGRSFQGRAATPNARQDRTGSNLRSEAFARALGARPPQRLHEHRELATPLSSGSRQKMHARLRSMTPCGPRGSRCIKARPRKKAKEHWVRGLRSPQGRLARIAPLTGGGSRLGARRTEEAQYTHRRPGPRHRRCGEREHGAGAEQRSG